MTDQPQEKPLPIIIEQEVELDPSATSHESLMERAGLAVAGGVLVAILFVKAVSALTLAFTAAALVGFIVFDGWAPRLVTTLLLGLAIYGAWTRIHNRRARRGRS